jgi:hypothetical protein
MISGTGVGERVSGVGVGVGERGEGDEVGVIASGVVG